MIFVRASLNIYVGWPWWIALVGIVMLAAVIAMYSYFAKNKISHAITVMAIGTSVVMIGLFTLILPRIEHYTQGPNFEFMKKKAGKNVYAVTYGFKSYSLYFYGQYPQQQDKNTDDAVYLIEHNMDKPVYIVSKCIDKDLPANPKVKLIGEQGGFRFWEKR